MSILRSHSTKAACANYDAGYTIHWLLPNFKSIVAAKHLTTIANLDVQRGLPTEEIEDVSYMDEHGMEEEREEIDLQDSSSSGKEQESLDDSDGTNPNMEKEKCSECASDCLKYQMQPRTKSTRVKTMPGHYKGFDMG